jgi:MATE family multidrug resistance protein
MGEFISLAGVSSVMTTLEWSSFEFMSLFASYLGITSVAVHVVLANLYNILYTIPLGISQAASTIIGVSLSRREVKKTSMYVNQIMLFSLLVSLLFSIGFFAFRYTLAEFFSAEPSLINMTAEFIPMLCIMCIFDNISVSLNGVIKGLGKQASATVASLLGYYCLNIPLGLTLAFVFGFGLYGLWIAIITGAIFMVCVYIWIIKSSDFEGISKKAAQMEDLEDNGYNLLI